MKKIQMKKLKKKKKKDKINSEKLFINNLDKSEKKIQKKI